MPDAQHPINVFYAYAPEDNPWLEQLDGHLSLLKRQGLISVWHRQLLVPGTDWAREIDTHMNSASVILLLISPDFLASDYCHGIEMKRILERVQMKEGCVIPILLRPVDWNGAPFTHLQVLPTDAKAITTWSNIDAAFADVAAGVRRAIEDLSQFTMRLPLSDFPQIWDIPLSRNPFFTGQEHILERLRTQFQEGQISTPPQALSGLGGVGKTQLAVEYAYRFRQTYQAVFWTSAESTETMTSSYLRIAALLNLPEHAAQEQAVIIRAVKIWLQTHQGWLLVLDNADEPDLLSSFLPPVLGGHLMLTTRSTALRHLGITRPIEVETFDSKEGAFFLLRRAGLLAPDGLLEQAAQSDQEYANLLSLELGGLPLALDQAGAYLEATGTTLETYFHIYRHHTIELLNKRRAHPLDHPDPVATTWAISFQRVEEHNRIAIDLLLLCAFLAPDAIGEELLVESMKSAGSALVHAMPDVYMLEQAIEALRTYSLIKRNRFMKTFTVHRLIQVVIRNMLSSEQQLLYIQRVIEIVNAVFPSVEFKNWPQCERCLPHALLCTRWIEQANIFSVDAVQLLQRIASYLQDRGQYVEAEPLYQRGLIIGEQVLGPDHPTQASNLNNLASLYDVQGKYEQAELLYHQALAIFEQVTAMDHPARASSLNNLAGLYELQKKYEEAESLYQRALVIFEQVLGTDHPDTISGVNNLARLYSVQGKYEEAESLYQQVLVLQEQILGSEHPDLARSLSNLASLYHSKGRYREAEPLHQRALLLCLKAHGTNHPDTANCQHNLALLYHTQHKYVLAESLYLQALTVREQVLGMDHPDIANNLNNLASLYEEQGKYTKSLSLYERALAISECVLGRDHPDIAKGLSHLALLYDAQRKYPEAELLYKRALAARERVLGADHLDTAGSLNDLAGLYDVQDRYMEAAILYRRVLTIFETMLGPDHLRTQNVQRNYSALLRRAKSNEEFLEL